VTTRTAPETAARTLALARLATMFPSTYARKAAHGPTA
jgi:hypothetical protein